MASCSPCQRVLSARSQGPTLTGLGKTTGTCPHCWHLCGLAHLAPGFGHSAGQELPPCPLEVSPPLGKQEQDCLPCGGQQLTAKQRGWGDARPWGDTENTNPAAAPCLARSPHAAMAWRARPARSANKMPSSLGEEEKKKKSFKPRNSQRPFLFLKHRLYSVHFEFFCFAGNGHTTTVFPPLCLE